MLDDFRHEKQDPAMDLGASPTLPLSKKVALLCTVVALVGLFIFFTNDSMRTEVKPDVIAKQIEDIQNRLTDLEQKVQSTATLAFQPTTQQTQQPQQTQNHEPSAPLNLQSIIDQEFQEAAKASQTSVKEAHTPSKEAQTHTSSKTYVVQKGDSLSKISVKCYGTTKKWKQILQANKEKLGNNQTIRPGMTLVIPQDE